MKRRVEYRDVEQFVRRSFEAHDRTLGPDTCVVAEFGQVDPDEISHFLESFSRKFAIRTPKIRNLRKHLAASWGQRGFQFGDVVRAISRTPEMSIPTLPLAKLHEIAEVGVWPTEFVRVPEGVDQD